MTPQQYGRATGQHTQRRQQAEMFTQEGIEEQVRRHHAERRCELCSCCPRCCICEYGEFVDGAPYCNCVDGLSPTRIDAYLGCAHPADEDWLRATIEATFAHADRIEIEAWSFPTEEIEPDLSAADLAFEYALQAAESTTER